MQIPEKLEERLEKLGIPAAVYDERTKKCFLSRDSLHLKPVGWCKNAYFVEDEFEDKSKFIFDPVSLVPCIALEPEKEDKILDMCAAPGTKTFIISFLTENEAEITANDISVNRVRRLKAIVNRNDLSVLVTNMSGRKIEGSFDKILLDAPCSGEGMINKKEKLFEHWSERKVKFLAKKQKKLASHAFSLLEPSGVLVYSTCTFGPEENEEVVDFVLKKFDDAEVEEINVDIKHENGLTEWSGKKYDERARKCMRIYPQHNQTTGFFVARVRKKA